MTLRRILLLVKEAFGAAGDGKTDDTRAFREAFRQLANKVPLQNYVLYVPLGEYVISDEIRLTRFLFVNGAGRDKTVIRLKDQCSGYGDSFTLVASHIAFGEWQ